MKICVFGLGYVGSVMAGCLARAGHRVVGVDLQPDRVDLFNRGIAPVIEPGLEELLRQGAGSGLITATCDPLEALPGAEVSFVCVGTPAASDGSLDTSAVESVCRGIGEAIGESGPRHTVAIRSTVMPGTARQCAGLLPQAARLCVNPEFLREGSAVDDFMTAPYILAGARSAEEAEPLRRVYAFLDTPFLVVEPPVAAILKTVSNSWHAAKVCFANEVARLCGALEIDPLAVMELFTRDARLNLSDSYLRPGFAYGGSCLPKDVDAIGHLARAHHLELPLLEGVPRSNRIQVRAAAERIAAAGRERVAFLGLSFKPGTDDLRGSPLVGLVEFCLGKGMRVLVHDPSVRPERLVGSNRRFISERIGHLADLLTDRLDELEQQADLFVLGHRDPAFAAFCRNLPPDKTVIDLVHLLDS